MTTVPTLDDELAAIAALRKAGDHETAHTRALAVAAAHPDDVRAVLAAGGACDRLGFERDWVWGDPPTDGGVRRNDVQIYFMRNARLAKTGCDREIMLYVEDVDALHAEHVRRGTIPVEPLRDERPTSHPKQPPGGQIDAGAVSSGQTGRSVSVS